MGAIMGAWGQIYEVYDWLCAHVPLLHWEHNYHGGHYRVCSHVITQSWGYSMALARWSSVTHGTQPQIHRDLHGDGINKPHPFMMKLRMVDDWVYHIGNYIPEISQNSKDVRWYDGWWWWSSSSQKICFLPSSGHSICQLAEGLVFSN